METKENPRQMLARRLSGQYEYECHVDDDSPLFDDEEIGRGGFMTISASEHRFGVRAKITGHRLWSITRQNGNEVRQALATETRWETDKGGIMIDPPALIFRYSAKKAASSGETTDTFNLTEDSLTLEEGAFEHRRADGADVRGIVRLRRMDEKLTFLWAPAGIKLPNIAECRDLPEQSNDHKEEVGEQSSPPGINISGMRDSTVITGGDANIQYHKDMTVRLLELFLAGMRDTQRSKEENGAILSKMDDLLAEIRQPVPQKSRVSKILEGIRALKGGAELVEKFNDLLG